MGGPRRSVGGERPGGRGLRAGWVRADRTDEHPGVRPAHRRRECSLRRHPQPVGPGPDARRLERRGGRGHRGRDVSPGPRQRRRRIHPDPGLVLRTGGPQSQPGSGPGPLLLLGGRSSRGGAHPRPRRYRRGARSHLRPGRRLLVQRPRSGAALPRSRWAPTRAGCGSGWRRRRRSSLAVDPVCVEAARAAAAALEGFGHTVMEADMALPSEANTAFLQIVNSGLADYEDVDWERDRTTRAGGPRPRRAHRQPDLRGRRPSAAAASPVRMWPDGARPGTCSSPRPSPSSRPKPAR